MFSPCAWLLLILSQQMSDFNFTELLDHRQQKSIFLAFIFLILSYTMNGGKKYFCYTCLTPAYNHNFEHLKQPELSKCTGYTKVWFSWQFYYFLWRKMSHCDFRHFPSIEKKTPLEIDHISPKEIKVLENILLCCNFFMDTNVNINKT